MWWTSILTLGFAIAGRLHRHGLRRQEEGELGEGLVRAQVMLGENLLERIEVGAGDQAPAAFASVAVGRADRVAAGAGLGSMWRLGVCVDPAEMRTRSQRHDELGLLADFLEGRFVTRARAGALDKGDGIALSFFTHRLPEANDLDGLEQLGGGLGRVGYRALAAVAAVVLAEDS